MTKDTFESNIQEVTLPVKLRDGTVHNVKGNPLPCKLDDLGCQSTSLDPYAYIWNHPDICVLPVLKEEQVNMIKNEHRYHMVSPNASTSKFLFEVKNYPQKFCNKPNDVYPTWPLEEKWELQEDPIPSNAPQTTLGNLDFIYTTEMPQLKTSM